MTTKWRLTHVGLLAAPQLDEDDEREAACATEPGPAVAVIAIVAAPAAEQQDQHDDEEDRALHRRWIVMVDDQATVDSSFSDRPATILRDLCGDLRVNDAGERSVIVPRSI